MNAALLHEERISGDLFYEMTDEREAAELVEGIITPMSRTGAEHGYIEFKLGRLLGNFVAENQLGWIVGGETGIYTKRHPDTVRAVDVAFISRQQSPKRPRGGFLQIAPELVIEIVSPNDLWRNIQDKIREYFAAGVKQIWIVDPEIETIWRYRTPRDVELHEAGDILHGEETLLGFTLDLDNLFGE